MIGIGLYVYFYLSCMIAGQYYGQKIKIFFTERKFPGSNVSNKGYFSVFDFKADLEQKWAVQSFFACFLT